MTWYHISEESNQTCIIPSEDNQPRKAGCMSPKQIHETRSSFEDRTWRLCVSPTIGQCIVSKPWDQEDLHLYEVIMPTEGPGAPLLKPIRDQYLTAEHRITDAVVLANKRYIELRYLGSIHVTREIDLWIKCRLTEPRTYPRTAQQELNGEFRTFKIEDGHVFFLPDTTGTDASPLEIE